MKTKKATPHRYLEQFVYGATDGAVSTFAVVAGSAGAGFSPRVALILGVANLVADGFSMGISSYLSAMAGLQHKRSTAIEKGSVTFGSFVVVGSIPLISYMVTAGKQTNPNALFIISTILTGCAFILIGLLKSVAVSDRTPVKSALTSLLLGGAAALAAYYLGYFVEAAVTG